MRRLIAKPPPPPSTSTSTPPATSAIQPFVPAPPAAGDPTADAGGSGDDDVTGFAAGPE